jgi:hypothetical protein
MRTRPRALVLTGALLLGLLMPTTAASAATPAGTAGSLDQASVQSPDKVRVRGWALDNAPGGAAINVAVYGLPRSTYGYQADLPLTAGTHRVCAYALNNRDNPLLGCTSVTRSGDPLGVVDSVTFTDMQPNGSYTVLIKGWSFDPDAASSPGGVAYYVRGNDLGADSSVSKQITTTVARPDVEAAYGLSTSTVGYEISFPYFACTKSVRLYALNQAGPGSNPIFFNVWNLATDHNGSDNPGAPPTNTVLCN